MGHYAAEMGYGDDDTPSKIEIPKPIQIKKKSKKQEAAEKKARRIKVKKICHALKIKEREFCNVILDICINGY